MKIDASLRDRLRAGLQRLILLYGELADDGRALLAMAEFSLDRVIQMLDHRDLVIQEVKNIELELVSALNEQSDDNSATELLHVVKVLEAGAIPALEDAARFRGALKALVEVDELVRQRLQDAQGNLDAEIKRLRRSSRLVQGYRPANPTGSAFIDKIK